jgi:ribonuclease HI
MYSSRDLKEEELVEKNQVRKFLASGKCLPPPFFQTTTIGCCLPIQSEIEFTGKPVPLTEYDQAVPYGRPLFAKMAEKNQLENRLDTVLSRMLLSEGEKWDKNQDSCLSILATRVQMGQTSTETASRLVAKGYASLVGFSDKNVARICYYPDPVCAHLAMAMMDKDWKIKVNDSFLRGKSRRWWIQQAADSFSCGLCLPNKGDVGEIFVAMYLLFCGDILRKKMDPTYRCFSVPLKSWVSNLIEPPAEPTDESVEPDTILSLTEPTEHTMLPVSTPSVSFIQVCSNYLRLYNSYEFVTDQDFLKNIYESGTAFFTHATCDDFDIVVPVRYLHNNRICFAPLLISIKARGVFGPGEANSDCNKMESKLMQTGCHRAVALVIIIGSSVSSNDKLRTLETKDIVDLFESTSPENMVIAKVLRVDMNDAFGISRTLIETTSDGEEMSEVLTSHSFVRAHVNVPDPVFVKRSMRGHKLEEREPYVLLSNLKKHFTGVPEGKEEEDLSHSLHSKPELASIVSQESAHPSVPNHKTIELWFHGRSRERAGAGAVVTIQPDDTTYHVRHVLHGTRTGIDLRFISNNQAQYMALVLALQVIMDYLRRQPPGTRLDSLVIHGDLELILKQLDGACKCKSQVVMPYYRKSLEMLRQCIDAYMTPLAIEKIRVEVHPDIQVLHMPRKHNSIAQGT